MPPFEQLRDVLAPVLFSVGEAILEMYEKRVINWQLKEDRSPVTRADACSHEKISGFLETFGWPVISEEGEKAKELPANGPFWVIDPLDGTKDFLEKTGEFSIMAALVEAGEPIFSAVYVPCGKKFYVAGKGEGTWVYQEGVKKRCRVSRAASLEESRFLISRHHPDGQVAKIRARYGAHVVSMGSVGVKCAAVCEGGAEATWNSYNLSIWDACAPHLLVEEAGGRVSGIHGGPISYTSLRLSDGFVATNGAVHEALLAFLAR